MNYTIKTGRVKGDKKVSTFGKVKKPFKSSNRNRKVSKATTPLKVDDNRLREKYSAKNDNRATDEELDYLDWLQNNIYPCFVCGYKDNIEYHHVKLHSVDKKNHKRLIPLCGSLHHRDGELSPHGGAKLWRDTFTLEEQYLVSDKMFQDFKQSIEHLS